MFGLERLCHGQHDYDLRTSIWVTYRLTETDIDEAQGQGRVNCFRKDSRIERGKGLSTTDYLEPIYEQRHLANDAVLGMFDPLYCSFTVLYPALRRRFSIW